jgi:hypothetical protein
VGGALSSSLTPQANDPFGGRSIRTRARQPDSNTRPPPARFESAPDSLRAQVAPQVASPPRCSLCAQVAPPLPPLPPPPPLLPPPPLPPLLLPPPPLPPLPPLPLPATAAATTAVASRTSLHLTRHENRTRVKAATRRPRKSPGQAHLRTYSNRVCLGRRAGHYPLILTYLVLALALVLTSLACAEKWRARAAAVCRRGH